MTSKVLIMGYGYVGQGVHSMLDTPMLNEVSVRIYDKYKESKRYVKCVSKSLLDDTDYIFVCVPTPAHDPSEVLGVLETLVEMDYSGVVILKSTVPYQIVKKYFTEGNLRIVANPEFLNQNSYIEDSQTQETIFLGGEFDSCNEVKKLYLKTKLVKFKNVRFEIQQAKDVINFKFTRNLYGAYKVLFWNFIQETTGNSRLMAEMLKHIPQGDLTRVGMDGEWGFGGACFPKDTAMFNELHEHPLTEFMIEYNKNLKDKK